MLPKRVLILGVTGMLGHTLFDRLSSSGNYDVFGTARSIRDLPLCFRGTDIKRIRSDVDADNFDTVIRSLATVQPDIVINCIGLIKQLPSAGDPLIAITINAQLPHRISMICMAAKARMIHISTDCVFDGKQGMYTESDPPSPNDLYGRTKLLGEVTYPHCVTLRTSIIGHELKSRLGLVEWFLAQADTVKGFTKAVYSGFPTVELSRIVERHVLPNSSLSGLYHISSEPISKYDLLKLIAEQYQKDIHIEPFDDFCCDRSLRSDHFRTLTGYSPPGWEALVAEMHTDFVDRYYKTALSEEK
jgi:dTDP-4-dehydrorhamnose reductase